MKDIEDTLINTRVWLFNTKWLPKRFRFYVFLHIFHSGELPMHDHGTRWLSLPLWGGYWEHTLEKGTRWIRPFHIRTHPGDHFHGVRVDATRAKCAITIWCLGIADAYDWRFMHHDGTIEYVKDFYKRKGLTKWFDKRTKWGFVVGKRTFGRVTS